MSMHINLKIGRDEYRAIPTEHIAYIEGHRRECTVHQWRGCGKPPLRISMCLSGIEPQLHQYHFVRCHRNFIVHPAALQWFGDKEIALPQGKAIPVSDMRLRRLPNGAPLPESYLYACILYGICLVGTQGGPLYASRTTLHQLLAMQPHLVRLNRWAVADPSAIAALELQPKPVAIMTNGVRLNGGGRRQASCPTKTQASIDLIINTLNIIASRFICKHLVDNTLTQQTSSPHPNFPNIRDRFQEKHKKNFAPRNPC